MKRRDALKILGGLAGSAGFARLLPACTPPLAPSIAKDMYTTGFPPNFELLHEDPAWHTTWSHIVPGRFSSSPYTGFLFYNQSAGLAALYDTDGAGRLTLLREHTGLPTGYTHVVPGFFVTSANMGVLFYDQANGTAAFYTTDGAGGMTLLRADSGWRTTWTHIIPGFFHDSPLINASQLTSLFLYSQSEGEAEVWRCDGDGNVYLKKTLSQLRTSWTHIVSGEFFWDPGGIDVDKNSHLFFYDAAERYGEGYFIRDAPGIVTDGRPSRFERCSMHSNLPFATHLCAGSFGGPAGAQLLFYNSATGDGIIHRFTDINPGEPPDLPPGNIALEELEILTGLPTNADIVAPGVFAMDDPEDHWFQDGPSESARSQWLLSPGPFSGLMLYVRSSGLGAIYRHDPLPHSRAPLEGYISSSTIHSGGSTPVSSGSVKPGETINLHISSQIGAYTVTIYRHGTSLEYKTQLSGLPPAPTPYSVPRRAYRDGAQWPPIKSYTIPSNWQCGLYVARVSAQGVQLDLPFVVRRTTPGSQGKILVVIADATYEAYNMWGGRDVYGYSFGDEHATTYPNVQMRGPYGFALSFDRPQLSFASEKASSEKWQHWEVPLIRWLERNNHPFEVCTSRDLAFSQLSTNEYRMLLFAGHHEYWSNEMRHNVEQFLDSGGNAAFFAGNTCWWRVRFEADGNRIICYKQEEFDPIPDVTSKTIRWKDSTEPEAEFTGLSYEGTPQSFDPDHQYVVTAADHWVFAGTNLQNHQKFGLYIDQVTQEQRTVIGAECDRLQINSPDSFQRLAFAGSKILCYDPETQCDEVGTVGIYAREAGSGMVLNAATMNWALGLSQAPGVWGPVDQVTRNTIERLRVQPFSFGRSAALDADGCLHVFVKRSEESIWYISQNAANGSWGAWQSLGGSFRSTPTTARNLDGHLEVFAVQYNNQVHHRWRPHGGNWSSWVSLGGQIAGLPVVAYNLDGRIELFGRGTDGAIWHAWQVAPNGSWSSWYSMGGSMKSNPAVVLNSDGRLSAFALGTDGRLKNATQAAINGPWGAWGSLGSTVFKSGPAVGRNLDGRLEVFAVRTDDQLAHIWQTSSGSWSSWTNVGVTALGTPAIGLNYDGRLEVIAVRPDKSLGHLWQIAPNGSWSSWTNFGISTSSKNPDISLNQDGRMEVFVAKLYDDILYHSWQVAKNGAWSGWASMGGSFIVPE